MLLIIIESTKVSNIKKTCYKFTDDAAINKHNTIYTNGNINVTKINTFVHFNDDSYFTKKIKHTKT